MAAGAGVARAQEGGAATEMGGGAAEERLFFTSQLGQLFCLRADDGALRWHQPAEVHGHSSPAVDSALGQGHATGGEAAHAASVVCVGGVDGSLHVFACADGVPLATRKLAGAIFSSPALFASRIVVGSRDDRLYCLELRALEAEGRPASASGREAALPAARAAAGEGAQSEGGEEEAAAEEEETVDPRLAKKLEALRRLLGK